MFEIDRTDFQILTAFKVVDEETVIILDKPTDGITIAEIMEYLDSVNARKSRKTVYLHLQKLMKSEYVKRESCIIMRILTTLPKKVKTHLKEIYRI